MTRNSAFLDDAARARVDLSPVDGEAVDALLRKISLAPPALIARLKTIVEAR